MGLCKTNNLLKHVEKSNINIKIPSKLKIRENILSFLIKLYLKNQRPGC